MLENRGERGLVAGRGTLLLFAVCAAGIELVLLAGFLLPLSIWKNPRVVPSPQVLAVVLGTGPGGALRFALPVLAAFAFFGGAVYAARRLNGRAAGLAVLVCTAVFCLTLLPTNPVTAHDVYHDVADARTLWLHGRNPALVAPSAFKKDPFLPNVPAWRDTPSAYGPLWYMVTGAPLPFTGDSLWPNVIAQKLIASAFLLAVTGLAMLCAAHLRPGRGVVAGVICGWCPLMLWECAVAAHNDVIMACFALLAVYFLLRGEWLFVFPALALSFATKPTLAVIAPLVLVFMLRQRPARYAEVIASLFLGVVVSGALFLPFYSGFSALTGLGREAGHVSSSPGALIHTTIAIEWHINGTKLLNVMKLIGWPLFLAGYCWLLYRLYRRPRPLELVRTSLLALFLFLLLITWWFMSWYVVWLVPLAALLPGRREAVAALAFALGAMLLNVPHFWLLHQNAILQEAAAAATAFVPPLLVALWPRRGHPTRLRQASARRQGSSRLHLTTG